MEQTTRETVTLNRDTYDQFSKLQRLTEERATFVITYYGNNFYIANPTDAVKRIIDELELVNKKNEELHYQLHPQKRPSRWQRLKAAW